MGLGSIEFGKGLHNSMVEVVVFGQQVGEHN
jgi:hypothetical protein